MGEELCSYAYSTLAIKPERKNPLERPRRKLVNSNVDLNGMNLSG
jgi:hypothetical protein